MTLLPDGQLWSLACKAYGDDLPGILGSIVSAYERRPGLTNAIRDRSVIGVAGFTALREALLHSAPVASISSKAAWRSVSFWRGISYAICSIS